MIGRLSVISLLCAEALALYTFAELIAVGYGSTNPHAVSALVVIVLVLAAYWLPHLLSGILLSDRSARFALTAIAVVLIYAGIRLAVAHDLAIWDFTWMRDFIEEPEKTLNRGSHAVIAGGILLFAWIWGAFRSNSDIEPELIARNIAAPFVLVTFMLILGADSHRIGQVGRGAVAFYAFDILALALSQLALSGATIGTLRSGGIVATMMAGTVGAVLVGVLLVTIAFAVIQPLFGPALGDALAKVLTWALTPFSWALQHFFEFLFRGSKFPKIEPSTLAPTQPTNNKGGHSGGELVSLYALRALAIVVVIAIVVGSAALVARLRRKSHSADGPVTVTSNAGSLGDDFGDLLRRVFHRPARPGASQTDPATQLYVEVLREAERRGSARPPSVTASEFAVPLRQAFQSNTTDEITHAFEQARYAGRPPDRDAIQRLRERWQQVR